MSSSSIAALRHHHHFHHGNEVAERGTRAVMWITAAAMLAEIVAGWWFNSMALLADGWHMSSHFVALGVSAMAYAAARRYAQDHRFAFGTWKIEVLGGFASALFLLGVAAFMVVASVERILQPQTIRYQEAMAVAVLGLLVNIACALILGKAHHHDHGTTHGHARGHGGHDHHHEAPKNDDLNLRAAYLHVVADATTSVLAIAALAGGWWLGWSWLDPVMGIVGAGLVAYWAKGLIVETSKVLLDREMDHPVVDEIREVVEQAGPEGTVTLTDLHVWRVGREAYACAIVVATSVPDLTPAILRGLLAIHEEVVHTTIEIHHAPQA
ncbi:CDF family Co(II)/Ni(II) efflux transporter DmeF [Hydrogenophaga sp.]|uniref:CDF family Co(II)/Ni(II) efflux transporter DmeF n=1 Tax=Hydrogenophaga sp. TaxID=1904254 RepID=UPI00272F38A8|nr:CDF family Co(II)/Ni(II) efflux transporter DmeF [Hydrogenophaga sp.]MDP2015385.1 CDF family Co(II)/Ni(II) efflux transporter DmeF [Hydrogenophaga sp.]MDP3164726.1 CDF family Co(II)/Ni(II) efflux transporter DmeF [Hydrogenophaga sp.]